MRFSIDFSQYFTSSFAHRCQVKILQMLLAELAAKACASALDRIDCAQKVMLSQLQVEDMMQQVVASIAYQLPANVIKPTTMVDPGRVDMSAEHYLASIQLGVRRQLSKHCCQDSVELALLCLRAMILAVLSRTVADSFEHIKRVEPLLAERRLATAMRPDFIPMRSSVYHQ